jgi:mannose-6-phosphate isomerase-like protein (cupin superfamily)
MPIAGQTGYLVRKLADAPSVPCPCGVSTRPLTAIDGAPCSLHVTAIHDSERHYHRETTEVYYILEGTGKIELNGDWHDLTPGTVIWIMPHTRHRVSSAEGLKTIVFSIPAFDEADEWFD